MARSNEPLLVVANWRDLRHPQAGGAELVCEEVAARLARAGHNVMLLAARVKGQPRFEQRDGYRIRRSGGRFTVYLMTLTWLLANRGRVHTILDSQNGIPFFTPLAARRDTTILLMIWHVHQDQFSAYFPRPVAALGRWLETAGSRAVYGRRMILTVSPSTRTGVRQDLRLAGEIRVVPPGWRVSVKVGEPRLPRSANPSIVSVGRLVPHKRTHLAIEAMPAILRTQPKAELHVVGSGPELARLRETVARLDVADHVHIHEHCSDVERDELVAAAWLGVNPSAGEGWGISVLEANALGIPTLAFARPGLRDSIRDEITGWLIEEGSSLAVAAQGILAELEDEAIADRFSREAVRWAANFTWEAMAEKVATSIAIERDRLRLHRPDRRRQSDVGTVVFVPRKSVPAAWTPNLRRGDGVIVAEDGVTILLSGADTAGAWTVIRRSGLAAGAERDVSVRIARGPDYLMPFVTDTKRAIELHAPE